MKVFQTFLPILGKANFCCLRLQREYCVKDSLEPHFVTHIFSCSSMAQGGHKKMFCRECCQYNSHNERSSRMSSQSRLKKYSTTVTQNENGFVKSCVEDL